MRYTITHNSKIPLNSSGLILTYGYDLLSFVYDSANPYELMVYDQSSRFIFAKTESATARDSVIDTYDNIWVGLLNGVGLTYSITKYSNTGTLLNRMKTAPPGNPSGTSQAVYSMDTDPSGNVYASGDAGIWKFNNSGSLLASSLNGASTQRNQLKYSNGYLYSTGYVNVRSLNPTDFSITWTRYYSTDTVIYCDVDESGNLYLLRHPVADPDKPYLTKLEPTGATAWNIQIDASPQAVQQPTGFAYSDGKILVAVSDSFSGRLYSSSDGSLISSSITTPSYALAAKDNSVYYTSAVYSMSGTYQSPFSASQSNPNNIRIKRIL